MSNNIEPKLNALELENQAVESQMPNNYYMSKYSGEEIDTLLDYVWNQIQTELQNVSTIQDFKNVISGKNDKQETQS